MILRYFNPTHNQVSSTPLQYHPPSSTVDNGHCSNLAHKHIFLNLQMVIFKRSPDQNYVFPHQSNVYPIYYC
jgi:hypothetical protein